MLVFDFAFFVIWVTGNYDILFFEHDYFYFDIALKKGRVL